MNNENKAPVRQIKFRGLRVDGKGWVYGDLKRSTDNRRGGTWHYIWVDTDDIEEDGEYVQVLPHTVGQFTGLLDKSGKEIYEGDIIKGELYEGFEIFWDNTHCGWNITGHARTAEVIGNIHQETDINSIEGKETKS